MVDLAGKKNLIPTLCYEPFEKLRVARPVDRVSYVKERCKGLRVLDLGAYDETEINKHTSLDAWHWLHAHIGSVAAEVLGVDNSLKLKEAGSVTTACGTRILYGDAHALDNIIREFRPDIVVAGELIEHTPDTLVWLSALGKARPGIRLLATTPNATAFINAALALVNREACHPGHVQLYSYKTLAALSRELQMGDAALRPYYYDPHLFYRRMPKNTSFLVDVLDKAVMRPWQFCFPLTAAGWIWEGTLGMVK